MKIPTLKNLTIAANLFPTMNEEDIETTPPFNSIEELTVYDTALQAGTWIEFIKKMPNLKNLTSEE